MATKKKTSDKETGIEAATVGTADPFEQRVNVELKPAKAKAIKEKTAAKPAKAKAAAKTKPSSKTIAADPFVEVAQATSPSAESLASGPAADKIAGLEDVTAEIAAEAPEVEMSPAFKALADVQLPPLQRENRARLQMQSPTRLYFYWSVKEDPWSMLKNVFDGSMGNYSLVVKLIDQNSGYEQIHQIDAEGSWWFEVEPAGKYRAEIGFYATGRPYFRVLYSNTVETPRRSPSPRVATESDWRLTATKFAQVLDVAGFSRDAFDVAMAGDDMGLARDASELAFASFIEQPEVDLHEISPEELRYALLALAAGVSLDQLKGKVGPRMFAILQANSDRVDQTRAAASLSEHFEVEDTDLVEEEFGAAVYGASLVNFPKTLRTKTVSTKYAPRYNPVSSHNLG